MLNPIIPVSKSYSNSNTPSFTKFPKTSTKSFKNSYNKIKQIFSADLKEQFQQDIIKIQKRIDKGLTKQIQQCLQCSNLKRRLSMQNDNMKIYYDLEQDNIRVQKQSQKTGENRIRRKSCICTQCGEISKKQFMFNGFFIESLIKDHEKKLLFQDKVKYKLFGNILNSDKFAKQYKKNQETSNLKSKGKYKYQINVNQPVQKKPQSNAAVYNDIITLQDQVSKKLAEKEGQFQNIEDRQSSISDIQENHETRASTAGFFFMKRDTPGIAQVFMQSVWVCGFKKMRSDLKQKKELQLKLELQKSLKQKEIKLKKEEKFKEQTKNKFFEIMKQVLKVNQNQQSPFSRLNQYINKRFLMSSTTSLIPKTASVYNSETFHKKSMTSSGSRPYFLSPRTVIWNKPHFHSPQNQLRSQESKKEMSSFYKYNSKNHVKNKIKLHQNQSQSIYTQLPLTPQMQNHQKIKIPIKTNKRVIKRVVSASLNPLNIIQIYSQKKK